MYIEDIGPCSDCVEDSILNASITISCVELKKANIVINKAVKKRLFCGSVKATNINEKIINI